MTFTITQVEVVSALIGLIIGYKFKTPIGIAIKSLKTKLSSAIAPKS